MNWTQKSNADTCPTLPAFLPDRKMNSEVSPVQTQQQMCGIDRWAENKEIYTLILYFFRLQSGNDSDS